MSWTIGTKAKTFVCDNSRLGKKGVAGGSCQELEKNANPAPTAKKVKNPKCFLWKVNKDSQLHVCDPEEMTKSLFNCLKEVSYTAAQNLIFLAGRLPFVRYVIYIAKRKIFRVKSSRK